jgi:hypothetical protein
MPLVFLTGVSSTLRWLLQSFWRQHHILLPHQRTPHRLRNQSFCCVPLSNDHGRFYQPATQDRLIRTEEGEEKQVLRRQSSVVMTHTPLVYDEDVGSTMLVDGISSASSLPDSRTLHTCGFWLSYEGAVNGSSLRLCAAAIIPSTNTAQLHIAAPTLSIEVISHSPCYALHVTPSMLHPPCYTLHVIPSMLHPPRYTLHVTPSTLHPPCSHLPGTILHCS